MTQHQTTKIMKLYFTSIFCLAVLSLPLSADEVMNHQVTIEQITKFSTTEDDQNLAAQLIMIKRTEQPSQPPVSLLCAVLAQANKYLSEHQKPEEVPSRNIAPPGGGLSGIDPDSISDPKQKAEYKKLLDDNRSLAEAHRKHSAVMKIRDSALDLLATHRVNGSIDETQLKSAIDQQSASEEQKITLGQLVKIATANKAQHPTDGAAEPEKPKE